MTRARRRHGVTARQLVLSAVRRTVKALRPMLRPDIHQVLYAAGHLGYVPHIDRPRTFNEKLLWLTRHHRDPLIGQLADKLAARAHVAELLPELTQPRLIGSFPSASDIPFASLPRRSVLKANHGSGFVRLLTQPIDAPAAIAVADGWLATSYGSATGEWQYQRIVPRLMVEEFVGSDDGTLPDDYKVYVLNGRAHHVQVFRGRGRRLERLIFDTDWNLLPVYRPLAYGGSALPPDPGTLPPRPRHLSALIAFAERLGAPFPFVRADFYLADGTWLFGELTFTPDGGHVSFQPRKFDLELGAMLHLPGQCEGGTDPGGGRGRPITRPRAATARRSDAPGPRPPRVRGRSSGG